MVKEVRIMDRLSLVLCRLVGFLVAFASLALILPTIAAAQVKPGDFITPENAPKVKDLVAPGVYYKVERGMTMKIVPTARVDWPPPYQDATEKYSSQVRLSRDKRSVVGYVAGQPFPLIDANDPDVAEKIVWNNVFRPITTDDYDLRFYDCDSAYQKRGPQSQQIEYFQIGHYAGFDPKTEQYFYKFLGEKNMLATIHAEHSPEARCATDGGTSACPEAWEMRHMYIVEALPDRSRVRALDSRTVIYMD